MMRGHIVAVEFLAAGSDENLIQQGRVHFARRSGEGFDAFEVWDHARKVYAWPEEPNNQEGESDENK